MSKNSRFAIAVHLLTLLALEEERCVSSEQIAQSVNTNPVIIRRILGMLRKAGLVVVQEGSSGGSRLAHSPQQITLCDVYSAVEERRLFPLHPRTPNPDCTVGRSITGVLQQAIDGAQAELERALAGVTIAEMLDAVVVQSNHEHP